MKVGHGLVLLIVHFVRTSGAPNALDLLNYSDNVFSTFSLRPSPYNAASVMMRRKREAQNLSVDNPPVAMEGGPINADDSVKGTDTSNLKPNLPLDTVAKSSPNNKDTVVPGNPASSNVTKSPVQPQIQQNTTTSPAKTTNMTNVNVTTSKILPNQMDINNPGVLKRALIVFGGFSLLGVAYFIFFKRKGRKNESNNNNNNDANQFRYGVLQSEDRRDNLELSKMPLTMDSDEDDDEDLEIFDLSQKKKSLSYVNLQTQEDDVDLSLPGYNENPEGNVRQDLLLDIEDRPGDSLVNWSNSANNKFTL